MAGRLKGWDLLCRRTRIRESLDLDLLSSHTTPITLPPALGLRDQQHSQADPWHQHQNCWFCLGDFIDPKRPVQLVGFVAQVQSSTTQPGADHDCCELHRAVVVASRRYTPDPRGRPLWRKSQQRVCVYTMTTSSIRLLAGSEASATGTF